MDQTIAFARNVKEELLQSEYTKEQRKLILAGLFLNSVKEPFIAFSFKSEISSCAQLVYLTLKNDFKVDSTINSKKNTNLKKSLSFIVSADSIKIKKVLKELELLDDNCQKCEFKDSLKTKNFKYLLIGLFLSSGSINNPYSKKTSYYLELSFNSLNDANLILKKLNSFRNEKTMNFKLIKRRDKYVIYLKKSDQISVFLSYINATECMFEFENARISKDDINVINRLSICDTSNLKKTMKAASTDIETINFLLEHKPINLFDKKSQAVINTRLNFPDRNLREIAEIISNECDISITKSGVAHILIVLRKQAEEFKKNMNK